MHELASAVAKILQRAVRIDARAFIQECAYIRKLLQRGYMRLNNNSRCASVRGSTVYIFFVHVDSIYTHDFSLVYG